MQHYLGVAGDAGINEKEIGAVESIVMAVAAGRVRAQLREARGRSRDAVGPGRGPGGTDRDGRRCFDVSVLADQLQ